MIFSLVAVKKFEPVFDEFGCDPGATLILPNIPLFSGAARSKYWIWEK